MRLPLNPLRDISVPRPFTGQSETACAAPALALWPPQHRVSQSTEGEGRWGYVKTDPLDLGFCSQFDLYPSRVPAWNGSRKERKDLAPAMLRRL